QIVRQIFHRHDLGYAARRFDDQMIDRKGVARHDGFVAWTHERPHGELDQFVRAVAEDEAVFGDAELRRDGAPQLIAVAVGIEMESAQPFADRLQSLRRRPQRVLVRGDLDRVLDAVLPLYLLDRLARLVGNERADVFRHAIENAHTAAGYEPKILMKR